MLTRDGRFLLDDRGQLVMAASGRAVLDALGQPIFLDIEARKTSVDEFGMIMQDDASVAQLRLVDAPVHALRKQGENMFTVAPNAELPDRPAPGLIVQGYTEDSAVNAVMVLNELIDTSRAIEQNAQMMRYMDNALGQTINTFGRVV